MVHYVGSGCHSYGDDIVMKLTVRVCNVYRRFNDFGLHKLPQEFPHEDSDFVLQVIQGLESEADEVEVYMHLWVAEAQPFTRPGFSTSSCELK